MGLAEGTSVTGHRGTGQGRTRGLQYSKRGSFSKQLPVSGPNTRLTVRPPEIFTPVHEEYRVYTSKI